MKRFLPELSLSAVLLVLVLAVCYWQAPAKPLQAFEVEHFIQQIDANRVVPAAMRQQFLTRLSAWGRDDDGQPVYMLNLMRYHEKLQVWPGAQVVADTPRQANAKYEDAVFQLAASMGLSLTVGSETQATGGGNTALLDADVNGRQWDRVLVVRYPSRRTFFQLISNPDYMKVMPYKFAALDVTLVPTNGATITPDLRLMAASVALILLLAFGWLRAVRRNLKA